VEGLNARRQTIRHIFCALLFSSSIASAATPKLKIKTKHGNALEEGKRDQIERLAKQYDLTKYTLTRNIVIEQGAINHSMPELTLNPRFLDNDDLALSAYIHEQGHWLLVGRGRSQNELLFERLHMMFPGIPTQFPEGSGGLTDTYLHVIVCMLEWQGMEDLVGAQRARKVIEWKQRDHYTSIYATVLENREKIATVMQQYGIKF
jgi:hypothetical protein